MKAKALYATLGFLTAVILAHQACSQVGFDASSSSSSGGGGGGGGTNDANGLLYGNSAISGLFTFQTAYNSGKVWVVTPPPTNTVNQITIDSAKTYPVKTWNYTSSGATAGGSRTFVTPVGLVFARLPAQLFLVNDNIPTSQNLAPIWTGANASASARACATSYQIGGASYVGVAWTTAAGSRIFTQIPIAGAGLDVASARDVNLGADGNGAGSAGWAYGCFTDQGNKIFWTSTPYAGSGPLVYGVNLNNLTNIASSSAHNAGKPIRTDATYTSYFGDPATGSGSYALSGDAYGNVLVGKAGTSTVYTMAHETKNDLTFTTGGGQLLVFPAKCASGVTDCTGQVAAFSEAAGGIGTGSLGPMSSLDDGRIVAISRGGPSAVYLIEPVDKTHLASGLTATAIAHIAGDAYMYTDFTGATLYPQNLDNIYDLRTFSGYNASLPIGGPSFTWNSQTGAKGEAWVGLKLMARCFNANTAGTAQLAPVTVQPSGQVTSLAGLATCAPGFDHIEITAKSDGSAVYTRTITITVSARQ